MKKIFIVIALLVIVLGLDAQIGYQVSLLNTATGEPRANEAVEVEIEITDSEGTSICKETKNTTTNDFGVLSLQVGNSTTFENADWSKLPFFVSATVDGILVGKSQILNVPVAEAAKTLVGGISKSDIVGKWVFHSASLSINEDGSYSCVYSGETMSHYNQGYYKIIDNLICFFSTNGCGVFFASFDGRIVAPFVPFYVEYESGDNYVSIQSATAYVFTKQN